MPGAPDPQYVQARKLLLDVVEALGVQREAVILIGAQAIYLRRSSEEIAVAEFTRDADLAVVPRKLKNAPALNKVMKSLGLTSEEPGIWTTSGTAMALELTNEIDLIVPAALADPRGRRAARLPGPHGKRTARKTKGVEGAVLDHEPFSINALEPSDRRRSEILVAGPTALLVSKLHKLGERQDDPVRLNNKDAFDVFRLFRATETELFAKRIEEFRRDDLTRQVTDEAIAYLRVLFGTPTSRGSLMAGEAAIPFENPEEITNACSALTEDLLKLV